MQAKSYEAPIAASASATNAVSSTSARCSVLGLLPTPRKIVYNIAKNCSPTETALVKQKQRTEAYSQVGICQAERGDVSWSLKWPILCWCATATRSRPPHWLYNTTLHIAVSLCCSLDQRSLRTQDAIYFTGVEQILIQHNPRFISSQGRKGNNKVG